MTNPLTPDEAVKLLPCSLDGGTAFLIGHAFGQRTIQCSKCGLESGRYSNSHLAYAAWNTRPGDTAKDAEIKRKRVAHEGELMPASWYQEELAKTDQQVIEMHTMIVAKDTLIQKLVEALECVDKITTKMQGLIQEKDWNHLAELDRKCIEAIALALQQMTRKG